MRNDQCPDGRKRSTWPRACFLFYLFNLMTDDRACFLNASIPQKESPVLLVVAFTSIQVFAMNVSSSSLKPGLCKKMRPSLSSGQKQKSLAGTHSDTKLHRKHMASWVKPQIQGSHMYQFCAARQSRQNWGLQFRALLVMVLLWLRTIQLQGQQGHSASIPDPDGICCFAQKSSVALAKARELFHGNCSTCLQSNCQFVLEILHSFIF